MPSPTEFQYTVLRLVPSVERGERMNVGVVVFCRQLDFLRARFADRRGASRGPRSGPRPRRGAPGAFGHLRRGGGRPGRRPARGAARLRALRLGRRALVDDHPALPEPHGPHRGPCGDARAALRDAGGHAGSGVAAGRGRRPRGACGAARRELPHRGEGSKRWSGRGRRPWRVGARRRLEWRVCRPYAQNSPTSRAGTIVAFTCLGPQSRQGRTSVRAATRRGRPRAARRRRDSLPLDAAV